MPYKLNGHVLLVPGGSVSLDQGTAPSSHSVAPTQSTLVDTIGGKIAIEPPTGRVHVHTWVYDIRRAAVVGALKGYIGDTPLCVIDTYDDDGTQLTNIVCLVAWPEFKSTGARNMDEGFSLVFTETSPQS
jgi:hypothetical protein